MEKDLFKEVEQFISRRLADKAVAEDSEDDNAAEIKLKGILSSGDRGYENYREMVDTINEFAEKGEAQKNKLHSYCLDFVDPTEKPKTIIQNGEEIQLNRFLNDDELQKLYKFVKRHAKDNTFGETVYKVMYSHNMTQPDVYKAGFLRRQDFSRVTDPNASGVTKRLAWQIIIGLHCSLEEADEVLFSAGYIRRENKFDLTMLHFIETKNYDILAINEVLYKLGLKIFPCYRPVKDKDNQ